MGNYRDQMNNCEELIDEFERKIASVYDQFKENHMLIPRSNELQEKTNLIKQTTMKIENESDITEATQLEEPNINESQKIFHEGVEKK